MVPESFATLLRRYRMRRRLTQEALAERTGISVRSIGAMERVGGRRGPRPSNIVRLADALDLGLDERAEFAAAGQQLFWSARTVQAKPGRQQEHAPAPRSLPPDTANFVGRTESLQGLTAMLLDGEHRDQPARVFTITGLGGVGKTALAIRWAHQISAHFPDGQLYVDLQGFGPDEPLESAPVLAQLLRAWGVPGDRIPHHVEDMVSLYRSTLADAKTLVVLDNARSAEQVRPLLPSGPHSLTLVTSRDNLTGLVVHNNARPFKLEALTEQESVQLLRQFAGAGRVEGDPASAAELASACGQLPLAISIAGALLMEEPARPLRHLAAQLREGDPFQALAVPGDERSAIGNIFDYSYHALPGSERRTIDIIGLIPGPDFTAQTLARMAALDPVQAVLSLKRLCTANLVQHSGQDRYRCHDLVKKYARDSAQARLPAQEQAAALDRLLRHYIGLVHAAATALNPAMVRLPVEHGEAFGSVAEAGEWLDAERLNLLAAVRAAASQGRHEAAILMADALRGYFWLRHNTTDWVSMSETALSCARAIDHRHGVASALISLAMAHHFIAAYDESRDLYERAVRICGELGWLEGEAAAIGNLGVVHIDLGRPLEAVELLQRSIRIYRRLGDEAREAVSRGTLGIAYRLLGDLHAAKEQLSAAVRTHRSNATEGMLVMSLAHLGDTSRQLGDHEAAGAQLSEAMRLARLAQRPAGAAVAGHYLADLRLAQGDHREAMLLAKRASAVARRLEDNHTITYTLLALGMVHLSAGRVDQAEACHAEALALSQAGGEAHPQAKALIGLALADIGRGRWATAEQLLGRSLARSQKMSFTLCEADAHAALAEVLAHQGEHERAGQAATTALELYDRCGYALTESSRQRLQAAV